MLTRPEYSFEEQLNSAIAWGTNKTEKALYDYNVTLQVTQWGGQPEPNVLFDYAWKEWSGLVRDYYKPRWEKFYAMLRNCLIQGKKYDEISVPKRSGREQLRGNTFYSQLTDWETKWIQKPKNYGKVGHPDEIAIVQEAFAKWSALYPEYVK